MTKGINKMSSLLKENLRIRIETYGRLVNDPILEKSFFKVRDAILGAIIINRKILIFGNGGSAAEAQHFAAELVCQFEKKRRAVPAVALTTDSSILTAQGNDRGFEYIFSRQIEALANEGDVVIGLTTSDVFDDGHSRNILNAFKAAKKRGAVTVGFFSAKTRALLNLTDIPIIIPCHNTALIQEAHLVIIHMLCGEIEKEL